jgi:hypothetical protein
MLLVSIFDKGWWTISISCWTSRDLQFDRYIISYVRVVVNQEQIAAVNKLPTLRKKWTFKKRAHRKKLTTLLKIKIPRVLGFSAKIFNFLYSLCITWDHLVVFSLCEYICLVTVNYQNVLLQYLLSYKYFLS